MPAALLADVRRLQQTLAWQPQHADLDAILRSALAWESRLPAGEAAGAGGRQQ